MPRPGQDGIWITDFSYRVKLKAAAQCTSFDDLYNANKAVYQMLRYPVQVAAEEHRRPDVVTSVNGIALGVIELKKAMVSVADGIRRACG